MIPSGQGGKIRLLVLRNDRAQPFWLQHLDAITPLVEIPRHTALVFESGSPFVELVIANPAMPETCGKRTDGQLGRGPKCAPSGRSVQQIILHVADAKSGKKGGELTIAA
jgi:hypothetical protein